MITIQPLEGDDSAFIQIVESAVYSLLEAKGPEQVILINIDNWFDFKWRDFSGKLLGALGTWNISQPRIPPFIPSRVVSERGYKRDDLSYVEKGDTHYHGYRSSGENITTGQIRSNSLLMIWYSGDTLNSHLGCLMVYDFTEVSPKTFYLSFSKKEKWKVHKTYGISRAEATELGGLNHNPPAEVLEYEIPKFTAPMRIRSPRLAPDVDRSILKKTIVDECD